MADLDITQLFQPATPADWLSFLLEQGAVFGLDTTAWQPGDPSRTILAIECVMLSHGDTLASQFIQSRFLDFAATGTVTGYDLEGNATTFPVTPDPSIPGQNDTGKPGLLDFLGQQEFSTTRLQSTAASGNVAIVNTTSTSQGTFAIGAFTVGNKFTSATYTNQASFTLSPSTSVGISGATAGSTTQIQTSSPHGLSTGNAVYITGVVGIAIPAAFYVVTVVDTTHFQIGLTTVGTYVSGGTVYVAQLVNFMCPTLGPSGNASAGAASVSITSTVGCFFGNPAAMSGAPWEGNVAYASRCRASTKLASPNGLSDVYEFYALSAFSLLQTETFIAGVSSITLDGGPVTDAVTVIDTSNGVVTTTVKNGGGTVAGCLDVPINTVSATTPIQVNTGSTPHNCTTGDYAQINGVGGNTNANGTFQVTVIDAFTVSLNGSTYGGTPYTTGGSFSGGDLFAIDLVIQAKCVPEAVTASEQSATSVAATVTGTVYVPAALVSTYLASMTSTFAAFQAGFPIGGLNVDSGTNLLPYGDIVGLLYSSGNQNGQIYTKSVFGVLVNGSTADLYLSTTGFAAIDVSGIKVLGV